MDVGPYCPNCGEETSDWHECEVCWTVKCEYCFGGLPGNVICDECAEKEQKQISDNLIRLESEQEKEQRKCSRLKLPEWLER